MSGGPACEVSIVLPCLNEAGTVGDCVRSGIEVMRELGIDGEVVVADNGSTDGSREIAAEAGARIVSVTARGYGSALISGILAARGTYIVMADADDTYDLREIGRFVESLRAGAELVMGNRFRGRIEPGAMPPLHRYLGNPVLSFLGRLFFHTPVGDFHSGLRAFRRDAILGLDLMTTGMEFASEMVVKASLYGLRVTEVPTSLRRDRRNRPPHLRTWRDGWRHLRFLLLYSPRWLFVYPGAAVMLTGAMAMALLLPGPVLLGEIGFDIHTLIYAAAAVIIGFQILSFGLFTKVFAIGERLLPPNPPLDRLFRYVTLETGLLVGLALLTFGAAGTFWAVNTWRAADFGALDDTSATLRIAVGSATSAALGVQVIFSSFFLSILGLRRR